MEVAGNLGRGQRGFEALGHDGDGMRLIDTWVAQGGSSAWVAALLWGWVAMQEALDNMLGFQVSLEKTSKVEINAVLDQRKLFS